MTDHDWLWQGKLAIKEFFIIYSVHISIFKNSKIRDLSRNIQPKPRNYEIEISCTPSAPSPKT